MAGRWTTWPGIWDEVSERTILTDNLNMLELAHIPYCHDPDTGGYRISRGFFLPPVGLTPAQSLAALMMTGRLRSPTGLPQLGQGARLTMGVEGALPGGIHDHIGGGSVGRRDGLDGTFEELTSAIAVRRVCKLGYVMNAPRQQVRLMILPLGMIFAGRGWHVLAWSVLHQEIRRFKLGCIRRLTVTDEVVSRPHLSGRYDEDGDGR